MDWLEKCLTCAHAYTKQDDSGTLYCRCRDGKCSYKEYKAKDGNKEVNADGSIRSKD